MPYIDETFYKDTYKGEPVDSADFPKLLSAAEMIVEEMTMFRLNAETFESMPETVREKIKSAVCAQIEYLESNGGTTFLNESDALQSAALGKFSYSKASESVDSGGNSRADTYSPLALRYLASTGLLYRGGGRI